MQEGKFLAISQVVVTTFCSTGVENSTPACLFDSSSLTNILVSYDNQLVRSGKKDANGQKNPHPSTRFFFLSHKDGEHGS